MSVLAFLVALLTGLMAGMYLMHRTMLSSARSAPRRAIRELEDIYDGLRTTHAIQMATWDAQASLARLECDDLASRSQPTSR
jgi:hypothetical protein